jgi:hypothetical protein
MATHTELNRLLKGRVFEEAQKEYSNNVEFRIIEEDGRANEIGIDTKSTRVNVIVKKGVITEVLGMY